MHGGSQSPKNQFQATMRMSQGNWSIVSSVGSGFNLPFINRKAVDYRHQMI